MSDATKCLRTLMDEARTQPDGVEWILGILTAADASAVEVAFFVQSMSVAAKRLNDQVLASDVEARCSFCMKSSRDVLAVVTAPSANICNECVEIARRTIVEKKLVRARMSLIARFLNRFLR